ncbi:MAG TPA: flotillin-like protein FloA [Firmicutes bacterium]|nr:flotillin-like protein FloA [Bacillota bacterium]
MLKVANLWCVHRRIVNKRQIGGSVLDILLIFPVIVFLAIIFLMILLSFIPVGLWISALAAGVHVGIINLIGMRLRRVPPARIILPLIKAVKAGLNVSADKLEAHYLAGGNVDRVVDALIAAHRAGISLTFERGAAIDLAGRNVLEAVQMSVNPKVIETPVVAAVAKDGIELKAKARVTVRANIDRLVGGAGEATIIARVGEGIVTTVGSAESHKEVLENPDKISRTVLNKGLDAGTAFEILSIDIADVDVGRNIGARLQMDQAEADKNIAQAKAAERRFAALAREQEMKAMVQEMRARVVEAEAEVPKAMADALRRGKLGVLDYYNLQNLLADTQMREAISRLTQKPERPGEEPPKLSKDSGE